MRRFSRVQRRRHLPTEQKFSVVIGGKSENTGFEPRRSESPPTTRRTGRSRVVCTILTVCRARPTTERRFESSDVPAISTTVRLFPLSKSFHFIYDHHRRLMEPSSYILIRDLRDFRTHKKTVAKSSWNVFKPDFGCFQRLPGRFLPGQCSPPFPQYCSPFRE